MPIARPTSVESLPGFRLRLQFEDGVEGVVDLSQLAGRGVFARWTEEPDSFDGVQVTPHGALAWGDDLDLCADALYLEITGALPESRGADA